MPISSRLVRQASIGSTENGTGSTFQMGTETISGVDWPAYIETVGNFSYQSVTLTSGNLTITGKVVNYRVFANGANGSFNINGGDTITVRQDSGFDWSPRSQLVDPVFNCVSGELDIFVEIAA